MNNNDDVEVMEQIRSEFQHGVVYMYVTIRASRQVKFCDVDDFKSACIYIYIERIDIRIWIKSGRKSNKIQAVVY